MPLSDMPYVSFSSRARKVLENRNNLDDDRIEVLEQMVKEATDAANEAEKKYDEVCVATCACCSVKSSTN